MVIELRELELLHLPCFLGALASSDILVSLSSTYFRFSEYSESLLKNKYGTKSMAVVEVKSLLDACDIGA